jgi:2-aminoethylphosphonate aminotransferase
MQKPIKRNILLNPGPATTTDTVKYAQVVPDICPREKEFVEIINEVRRDLLKIVNAGDDYTCILFAGSGTAAMDAVINSAVPPEKKILIINNGAYGERMLKIAKAYHIDLVEAQYPWTDRPDLNEVEIILKSNSNISHVAMVHHETTTGILNPLEEMAHLIKRLGRVFIVDAISSFAGIPIDVRHIPIDFLMSTSNKCIQGIAGISFVICNKNEVAHAAQWPPRSFYLNLNEQYRYFEEHGEMQFTPPVQVIYALRQAIKEYFIEGRDNRYSRYVNNWEILTNGIRKLGFKLLLKNEIQSKILTTFIEPHESWYDFQLMHDMLLRQGFTIYPGKIGNLKTFRIANLGAIDSHDIEAFISTITDVIQVMKERSR